MLETMATLILVIVGIVLFMFIVAYGIYITFYPLRKTIGGGIEVMKEYAEQREKKTVAVAKKRYARAPAAQLQLAQQVVRKGKN